MKKIILSVFTVLTFGLMNAQETKFGLKGGLNIASLTGDGIDADSKMGFHLGGFVEIKVSEKFSIQPEVLYSQQGAKADYVDSDGMDDYNVTLTGKYDYLNIPIMAKFYPTPSFSLQAGPQIGFLLSAKDEYEIEAFSITNNVKDDLNTIDFGFNFGFGYEFTKSFFADARYNVGLSNMVKESEGGKTKNSVIQISVGYKF